MADIDTSTDAVEQRAQALESAYEWLHNTAATLRALASERDTLAARVGELEAALQGLIDAYENKTWGTVYAMERELPYARAALRGDG